MQCFTYVEANCRGPACIPSAVRVPSSRGGGSLDCGARQVARPRGVGLASGRHAVEAASAAPDPAQGGAHHVAEGKAKNDCKENVKNSVKH